jgi:hypothetical protein
MPAADIVARKDELLKNLVIAPSNLASIEEVRPLS